MKIPFFRYPHVFKQHEKELTAAFLRVAESGSYIMQRDLREFEERLAGFCGAKYAVGVGNATDAIELNLEVAGVGTGDEVILPAHTFVASAAAVRAVGATPVFAEVGFDHLMDVQDAAERITGRTKALMPTQLNGRTADMDAYRALAESHGLTLLEDSAQGLGSLYKGAMAGTFGLAGVYSFYPAKTLGAFGDAGACITNDEGCAETLLELRDHGRSPRTGEVVRWGRNSRMDNLQAALLLVKLQHLDEEIARRREIAARYCEGLGHLQALTLPPAPEERHADHFDVFQNFELEADGRDELREYLSNRGVATILQWGGKAVHEFEALSAGQDLPRTEQVMRRSFLLPMNTSVTDQEIEYICNQIERFYDEC